MFSDAEMWTDELEGRKSKVVIKKCLLEDSVSSASTFFKDLNIKIVV